MSGKNSLGEVISSAIVLSFVTAENGSLFAVQ